MTHAKKIGHHIERTKRAVLVWPVMAMLAIATAMPSTARADTNDDNGPPDARVAGFSKPVIYDGGVALSYIFMAFLGVVALASMFKDAKRTHLD